MKEILLIERFIECDMVLFFVGLIFENELSKKVGIVFDMRIGGLVVDNIFLIL